MRLLTRCLGIGTVSLILSLYPYISAVADAEEEAVEATDHALEHGCAKLEPDTGDVDMNRMTFADLNADNSTADEFRQTISAQNPNHPIFIKGTLYWLKSLFAKESSFDRLDYAEDYCVNEKTLVEYYCQKEAEIWKLNKKEEAWINCSLYNAACRDGRCVSVK